jgi:23S rRNA (uracil1939-C5)-methyltransferase
VPVEDVLPSPRQWGYRNKMDFTFGSRRWIEPGEPEDVDASFAVGLHVAERWQKVLDVRSCALAFEGADAILATARELARERALPPWDVGGHHGLLRHLVLRKAFRTGEILAALVTSEEAEARIVPYLDAICERHPEITTCVQMIHSRAATVAMGEREIVRRGSGRIHEHLGGLVFAISAGSFFQTNTEQAERLVEIVREEADLARGSTVWDLYCGAGTLGLVLASTGARILGIESIPSAVADARANAERNGIDAATFVLGEVERELPALAAAGPRPDLCVVDPPRAGLHARALSALAALSPRAWSTCPATSRPLRGISRAPRARSQLVRARPLDLFPHTPHVECVFTLLAGRRFRS